MPKRITPEEYEQWLAENRPDITVLEAYKGTDTKIMHQCSRGHEPWAVRPRAIKRGHGCAACFAESIGAHPSGYWTLERCKADAKQYTTKQEWRMACTGGYERAKKQGWMGQCTGHMEPGKRPDGYWTFERCFEDAANYDQIEKWKKGSYSGYSAARRYGWLEQCTAHMVRTRRTYTDAELLADAKQYTARSGWKRESNGHYSASKKRGKKFHERACAHMKPPCSSFVGDRDTIYLYEWIENGVGTGIYKAGVTSWRLGDARIKQCTSANGIDYRLIALCETSEGDALMFESVLLDMGDEVALPDHIVDGRTEFRIYSDDEMQVIFDLMGVKEAQAEAA